MNIDGLLEILRYLPWIGLAALVLAVVFYGICEFSARLG